MVRKINNMKKHFYILLLVSFSLFGQQSYYTSETPHSCVFRETFNNEYEVRNNGGKPTDVTFSDGKESFNGTTSRIDYLKFTNQ